MVEEYTPTTATVKAAYVRALRNAFIASEAEHEAEFDRWLAKHDEKLREEEQAKAWRNDPRNRNHGED